MASLAGLEPATFWTATRRSNPLSYKDILEIFNFSTNGEPDGNFTVLQFSGNNQWLIFNTKTDNWYLVIDNYLYYFD